MIKDYDLPVVMRNGVKLYMNVCRPDTPGWYPVLYTYALHNKNPQRVEFAENLAVGHLAWSTQWYGVMETEGRPGDRPALADAPRLTGRGRHQLDRDPQLPVAAAAGDPDSLERQLRTQEPRDWAGRHSELGEGALERRALSPEMALRLSRLFGNSPEFWLNAQRAVDLWDAAQAIQAEIDRIKPPSAA